MERGEGRRGGAEGGGPCLGRRGGYAAGGGGRCAGLDRVRGAAGMGGADGAQRGGWREPRAAGVGWAVTVAARLEAEEGAQSSVVSPRRGGGGGAGGTSDVDQSARGGRGCRGGLRRRGAGLAGWNPRFNDIGQAAVVGGRGGGATMRRYRVQGQEDGEEDGIQRRGPGFGVNGVGEGITRPGERGAALDEFLGRGVGRWFDAGVGEELDAIGGRWQGDLGGLQMVNVAGAMILLLKEGSEELVDFFG